MLFTPHQVALHCDRLDLVSPTQGSQGVRWTWIAGRRFRSVRRL
ncbi:MAG: hypothetical protein JWM98_1480 [Thermoleophilia bacterium]|nr:hypothetical protein [Thermoleophilia bacterium]